MADDPPVVVDPAKTKSFLDSFAPGNSPQTPLPQWQIATGPDGSMWWYDQNGQARQRLGQESYRTINGQLVATDPAGNAHVVPVQGLQPAAQTPSAQLSQEKVGKSGEVVWAGYSPVAQWTDGGSRVNLDAYDQVSLLQGKIQELQGRKAEYENYAAHPEWSTPGERGAETAAVQQELDQINKDLTGYTNQLQMVAQKYKLNLGGAGGTVGGNYGGTPRETAQEVYAKEAARLQAQQEALQWKYDNGYEVKPAELENLRRESQAALQRIQDVALMDRQRQAQAADEPYKQAAAARDAAQLKMTQDNANFQRNQARANLYMRQADQGQQVLDQGVKMGVAPSLNVVQQAMFDPFARAMELMGEAAQNGEIDPSWLPKPIQPSATPPQVPGMPPEVPQLIGGNQ